MHKLYISNAPRPNLVPVIKISFSTIDVYGEIFFLFTLILKKVNQLTRAELVKTRALFAGFDMSAN